MRNVLDVSFRRRRRCLGMEGEDEDSRGWCMLFDFPTYRLVVPQCTGPTREPAKKRKEIKRSENAKPE
jgi:hypothetical protein